MKGLFQIIPVLFLLFQTTLAQDENLVYSWVKQDNTEKLGTYLQDHDIDERRQTSGMTLLVYSIFHSKLSTTEYLLDNGADVNLTVGGLTPLMYAAKKSEVKKVYLLINAGANLEIEDLSGNTALFYAAATGNLKTTRRLVKKGAIVSHRNGKRQTAYDMAVRNKHQEIAKCLRTQYEKNLPDMVDGPYIKWTSKNKIKAFYMVHDSKTKRTKRIKSTFKADSDPYLIKGFAGDSMDYLVYSEVEVPPDLVNEVERVMVIGDIHGGYDSLLVFLQQNGVIDKALNWSWGSGKLVFVGDIFDRGEKVTEALWLIYKLEQQAPESGGSVQLILGNHELMVLSGKINYVADKYLLMSSRLNINYSFLFGKKTVLGQWLRSKNTIIRINGHLFVHAGLSPSIMYAKLNIHEINEFVRFFIDHPDREIHKNVNRNTLLGHNGPFWYRGYLEDNHDYKHLSDEGLEEVLEYFDANYIFIGHTNVEEITPMYNNRVFAIDVPFYSFKHSMYGLLLKGDDVYLLNTSGEKKQIR